MSSQPQPVTPVRVPKAATAYTPTTQDPDLRSQINTLLLREGHIEKIEQTLHHALHAHPSNWPQKISQHALSLLRSGEYTTFPTLMERVLEDVRRDTAAARITPSHPSNSSNPDLSNSISQNQSPGSLGSGSNKAGSTTTAASAMSRTSPEASRKLGGGGELGKANGTALGKGKALVAGTGAANGIVVNGVGAGEGSMGLAVPQTVIEEGIRITRECLEQVCEVDE